LARKGGDAFGAVILEGQARPKVALRPEAAVLLPVLNAATDESAVCFRGHGEVRAM